MLPNQLPILPFYAQLAREDILVNPSIVPLPPLRYEPPVLNQLAETAPTLHRHIEQFAYVLRLAC